MGNFISFKTIKSTFLLKVCIFSMMNHPNIIYKLLYGAHMRAHGILSIFRLYMGYLMSFFLLTLNCCLSHLQQSWNSLLLIYPFDGVASRLNTKKCWFFYYTNAHIRRKHNRVNNLCVVLLMQKPHRANINCTSSEWIWVVASQMNESRIERER